MDTDKITLQTILHRGYRGYACTHALPAYVRRAVWAILACRPALLGGDVQVCPEGHRERIWYHACRHRMGPPCAWVQTERWLAKHKARLLACDHSHVIFTSPHELNALGLGTVEVMSRWRFASGHGTRLELLGGANYLGGKPGILATLHTWRQTLVLHPHVHCRVTGGGLHVAGQWGAVRHGFLLPMRVVMAVCRGNLRAAIHEGMQHGQLTPPAGRSRQQLENRLNKQGRPKGNVHMRERYPHGQGVLVYLARYLRGGPLSHRRLRACDGQRVVFAYAARATGPEGQARQRTLDLPLEQFSGRWLSPVPPAGAVRVRCWGRYAHTQGAALAQCRRPLGPEPVAEPEPLDGLGAGEAGGEAPPERCPVCGQPLGCTALLPRAGVPPPTEPGWAQVA